MAESVDALVSNTNVSNDVPVRPRLRVLKEKFERTSLFLFDITCYISTRRDCRNTIGWTAPFYVE